MKLNIDIPCDTNTLKVNQSVKEPIIISNEFENSNMINLVLKSRINFYVK
jgi:hypothetical protein